MGSPLQEMNYLHGRILVLFIWSLRLSPAPAAAGKPVPPILLQIQSDLRSLETSPSRVRHGRGSKRSRRDIWVPKFNLGTSHSWASGPPKTMKLVAQAFQPVPGHPRAGVLHFQSRREKIYCTWATLGSERWALMTRRARGAASSPPWPPCSTKTATATWGSSAGA